MPCFKSYFDSSNFFKKTSYELWKDTKPNIKYFHIFGCRCFVLNNSKDNLENFHTKSNEKIFLGYSTFSKIYRIFNKRTLVVEESIHVVFDESIDKSSKKDDVLEENVNTQRMEHLNLKDSSPQNLEEDQQKKNEEENRAPPKHDDLPKEWRYAHGHPKELIIGDPSKEKSTHSSL